MSVKVHIHTTQRHLTDGLEVVEVQGKTVKECLEYLVGLFPEVKEGLFEKKGKLRNHIEIYVNLESAYPDELGKAVKDGDDIHVSLMLAGG